MSSALGALSPAALRAPLSRPSMVLRARPPSARIGRFAMFTQIAATHFSGSGCRPNDFCSCTSDARTHSRASDSRAPQSPALAVTPRVCARLHCVLLRTGALPLSKKDCEYCEPIRSFRCQPHGAASAPQSRPRKLSSRRGRRLRATPQSDHRSRRWAFDDNGERSGPSRP